MRKMTPPMKPPKQPVRKEPYHGDLFDMCLKKGLIEKTPYGYYFTAEFFESLKVYEEK